MPNIPQGTTQREFWYAMTSARSWADVNRMPVAAVPPVEALDAALWERFRRCDNTVPNATDLGIPVPSALMATPGVKAWPSASGPSDATRHDEPNLALPVSGVL